MGFVKTVHIYKCDVCGKEEVWGDNWLCKLIPHKSGGPGPWDEIITVCSVDCKLVFDHKGSENANKVSA